MRYRPALHGKIYKGDLPLMYSYVFWCEFIHLGTFLAVTV